MRRLIHTLFLLSAAGAMVASEPSKLAATGPEAPPSPKIDQQVLTEAIGRGQLHLINSQNKDGSWGSARGTKGLNIYAPVPGAHQAMRASVTALCVMALIETAPESADKPELVLARKWLFANLPKVKRGSPDTIYNIWAHTFGIQALLRLQKHQKLRWGERRELKKQVALQIERLVTYETVNGGWAYYNFGPRTRKPSSHSNSFMDAAVLVALYEAKKAGRSVPKKVVQRAIKSLQSQRKPDCSYLYSGDFRTAPGAIANRPAGSLGRSQACNFALQLWGDKAITTDIQRTWLKRIIARQGWLDAGRKRPKPHESWFAVAGYYYYFGFYHAARNVEMLPKKERGFYQDHLAKTITDRQEKDGSWWDFPLYSYHKPYGTAFALMTLQRCRKN